MYDPPDRPTTLRGQALLADPRLNKQSAFTDSEREELGLVGPLPQRVETIDQQLARVRRQLTEQPSTLAKNVYLPCRGPARSRSRRSCRACASPRPHWLSTGWSSSGPAPQAWASPTRSGTPSSSRAAAAGDRGHSRHVRVGCGGGGSAGGGRGGRAGRAGQPTASRSGLDVEAAVPPYRRSVSTREQVKAALAAFAEAARPVRGDPGPALRCGAGSAGWCASPRHPAGAGRV